MNKRWFLSMLVAPAVLLAVVGRSPADLVKLDSQMDRVAIDLKQWLTDNKQPAIARMTSFKAPPYLATSVGAGLAHMLDRHLKLANVPVRLSADIGIMGELICYPAQAAPKNIKKVKIALQIYRNDKVLHEDSLITEDPATIATLVGRGPDPSNNPIPVQGGPVMAGPYGVEILSRGQRRPAQMEDGLPTVDLQRGDVYTIKLYNNSHEEAAVWVGIDGLSIYDFNEEREPNGKWRDWKVLVGPRSKMEVEGWYFHSGKDGSKKFLVTDYPETAAALKGITSGLGMITVQFWTARDKAKIVPPRLVDQKLASASPDAVLSANAPAKGMKAESSLGPGTGFGAAFTQNWQSQTREFGPLEQTITLRYAK